MGSRRGLVLFRAVRSWGDLVTAIKSSALAACLLACSLISAKDTPPEVLLLWPEGAPGAAANGGEETVRITEQGERVVSNVHRPSLTVYLPKARGKAAAVIVVPGGGHRELW